MLIPTKPFEDFYNEIRNQFPGMRELKVWDEYDWSSNGDSHSLIMSDLSREMTTWASRGELDETQRLMNFVEKYFNEGDSRVTSIIYTDFLVTIMEIKNKEVREIIKRMMGPETEKHYKQLFHFYREAD